MVVLTADTAEEWQEVASRSFVPLECETPSASFSGSLENIRLGSDISVCDVSCAPAVINRTPRLAARADSDDLHFSLQVRSTGVIRQGTRQIPVRPGSASVYVTHMPYQLDYSEPGQRQIIVQIPRARLDLPGGVIESVSTAMAMSESPAQRVFFSYVASLLTTHDDLDQPTRENFAQVAAELAATMMRSSDAGRAFVPSSAGSLLYTIQTFIREESHAAELTLDDVARAHFISRRKLYDLFSELHTTPSAYVRDQRLSRASRLLRSADQQPQVSGVAAECGFSDVTTFTRAFRKRFGMTPGEWRRAHVAA